MAFLVGDCVEDDTFHNYFCSHCHMHRMSCKVYGKKEDIIYIDFQYVSMGTAYNMVHSKQVGWDENFENYKKYLIENNVKHIPTYDSDGKLATISFVLVDGNTAPAEAGTSSYNISYASRIRHHGDLRGRWVCTFQQG